MWRFSKIINIGGLLLALTAMSPTVNANNDENSQVIDCESECQLNLVQEYFSLLNAIGKQGSTAEDINNLISVMHNEIKYIHVRYEANFDKTSWQKAFMRNLKRGFYTKNENQEIRILDSITGRDYMAIEYAHGKINEDGVWQADEGQLVLFGFTDGKISLVKELW